MRNTQRLLWDDRGIALLVVLLLLVALSALSLAAVAFGGLATRVNATQEKRTLLETAADAGIEEWIVRIAAQPQLFPGTGYRALENGDSVVRDAYGQPIPGLRRWVYVGPINDPYGQFGRWGAIVVVAESPSGERVVRWAELTQQSFAQFAYFTDLERSCSGGSCQAIWFVGGDEIDGPLHTNDTLRVYVLNNRRPVFRGPVSTARIVFQRVQDGDFLRGVQQRAPRIELPRDTVLAYLGTLAQQGSYNIVGDGASVSGGQVSTRLEFLTADVYPRDGTISPDEAFFMVYQGQPQWVSAIPPNGRVDQSLNCGDLRTTGGPPVFLPGVLHPNAGLGHSENAVASVVGNGNGNPNARCYLGGDWRLWEGRRVPAFAPEDRDPRNPLQVLGRWLPWPGPVLPTALVDSLRAYGYGPLVPYLWPISRVWNPNARGVIHVTGNVGISGRIRGRITVAATGDIVILDDLVYTLPPTSSGCRGDMLGLFAGDSVIVADNALNTPQFHPNNTSATFFFDDPGELATGLASARVTIHAVVLASRGSFAVQNHANPPTASVGKACMGASAGRGCLELAGGIIQRTRGAVGTFGGSGGGTGFMKRYSYDVCAGANPPPYFPTTGVYQKVRIYDVDPVGFRVADFFDRFQRGS